MIKNKLYDYCVNYVNERINSSQTAITVAQAAANEEGKSSAGDKYETGRAMMQLEIENNTSQLLQTKQLRQVLEHINITITPSVVQQGALVETSQGTYYIAIGAGLVNIDSKPYYLISLVSPIGAILKDKKVGDKVIFNGKEISILAIN